MQSIWRIVFIILVVCSTLVSNAQTGAAKQYFSDNILTLDPIEGVWEVEDYMYIQSGSLSRSRTATTTVEIKRQYGNKFKADGLNLWFERIGETNAYTLTFYSDIENTNKSLQIVLESNGFSFSYRTKEQPNRRSFRTDSYSYIKSYPSISMYEEALRKAREAEQQAIEATQSKSWSGTGFAILNNYIVTNYHVVENSKSISIQGINGNFNNKYGATVVATDKVNDLAILKVIGTNISKVNIPYSVKTSTSEVGEEIFVLGYPLTSTMGDEIKLTTGVISSKSGFQGDVSLYVISAPIQPGNSGGPLFDSKGNVIGVVSAKHRGAENVGYAIKASYLRNLMESTITTNVLPQTNRISAQNLSGKVKAVKNFVYYIVCSSENNMIQNSGMPISSSGTISSSNTVSFPSVRSTTAERAKIKSIYLGQDYTAVEIINKNTSYEWCNIDRNTYIMVSGTRYTMTKAEGIKIAPDKTYFSYEGQDITFTLYFPPIPTSATSMDLIESADSKWKFYDIKIR